MKNNTYAINPFNKVITFYNYKDCSNGDIRIEQVTYTKITADIVVHSDCPGELPYSYEGANSIPSAKKPVKSISILEKIKPITRVYSVNDENKKEYYELKLF
jgi:hypothetical protein